MVHILNIWIYIMNIINTLMCFKIWNIVIYANRILIELKCVDYYLLYILILVMTHQFLKISFLFGANFRFAQSTESLYVLQTEKLISYMTKCICRN